MPGRALSATTHRVFGIRHHGPGCARALLAELSAYEPDCVLVEGPPDADKSLRWFGDEALVPPVALLVYAPEHPDRAVMYPFTSFSPEWVAIRWARTAGAHVQFMDLPQTYRLRADLDARPAAKAEHDPAPTPASVTALKLMAQAGGFENHEQFWDRFIELRHNTEGLFDAILELMTEVRGDSPPETPREARREAYMRKLIRAAVRKYERVAVVCGAWHAPMLTNLRKPLAKDDNEVLKGMARTKVSTTWIPWTHSRLSWKSGYGAGITSPGWYAHLWSHRSDAAMWWIAEAAQLLREEGMDASPASVIESVRLAQALAALRDLPGPGLDDLHEAMLTVLCHGEPGPMQLVRSRLEIGEQLGGVPDGMPSVPLQRDLTAQAKRLRLRVSADERTVQLDLRKPTGLLRSQLLHRLKVLGIEWGETVETTGLGTFKEAWRLQWDPMLAVSVVEAARWGNTVDQAATARLMQLADAAPDLPSLSKLLDRAILASLPTCVHHTLLLIRDRAAVASDVRHLMGAIPSMARVLRYGDVRNTPTDQLRPVLKGLLARIVIGLPSAVASLDDDAAAGMVEHLSAVNNALGVLDDSDHRSAWEQLLERIADTDGVHGLVRGYAVRLLMDAQRFDDQQVELRAGLALSSAASSASAAAWLQGLLKGSGLMMLHCKGLWRALDRWMQLPDNDAFTEILPLLRRAFAEFTDAERRRMGDAVATLDDPDTLQQVMIEGVDPARAARSLPVLRTILGVST